MDRSQFLEFLDGLGEAERLALYNNTDRVATLATQLVVEAGSAFTLKLERKPGIIAQLKRDAAYEGYVEKQINDDRYPTTPGGIVDVRYRIVRGEELKRADGYVYRSDVEARFRDMRMRFPDAAEALLPPARDRNVGRGDKPYVAFICGSQGAFFVGERGGQRRLRLNTRDDDWYASCAFVGVCE